MGLYEDMVAEEARLEAERVLKSRAGVPAPAQDQLAALEDLWVSRDKYSSGPRGLGERLGDLGLSAGGVVSGLGALNPGALLSKGAAGVMGAAAEAGSKFASEFGGGLSGAPSVPEPGKVSRPVLPKSLTSDKRIPPGGLILGDKSKSIYARSVPDEAGKSPSTLGSGNLKAYKTPEGKVYFSNHVPTEGATEVSYKDTADALREKINPGAEAGSFSVIQGTDEMIRDRATRDAMMRNLAAEASLSSDDKFKRDLSRQREVAEAQSQTKMAELRRLTDFYMGQVPAEDSPIFEEMKGKIVEAWKKDPRKQGIPDQKLWENAHLQARAIMQEEAAAKALKYLMIQNRMASEPMMMSSMDTPNAQ